MFTDDADRLAFIQSLGGQLVRIDGRSVFAVFENEFAVASIGLDVETTGPMLDPCRMSDIAGISKDAPVEIGTERYRVRRIESDPATGLSRVVLRR